MQAETQILIDRVQRVTAETDRLLAQANELREEAKRTFIHQEPHSLEKLLRAPGYALSRPAPSGDELEQCWHPQPQPKPPGRAISSHEDSPVHPGGDEVRPARGA